MVQYCHYVLHGSEEPDEETIGTTIDRIYKKPDDLLKMEPNGAFKRLQNFQGGSRRGCLRLDWFESYVWDIITNSAEEEIKSGSTETKDDLE